MVLKEKCIGCGKVYGEKGTERNGGVTGGACDDCKIRGMEIDRRHLEDRIEAFPCDPSHSNWEKRLKRLKPKITRALIERQEKLNKKEVK